MIRIKKCNCLTHTRSHFNQRACWNSHVLQLLPWRYIERSQASHVPFCSLAEELVAAAQAQDAAATASRDAAAARAQAQALVERLTAAEELLGEREEELSELQADVADVKQVRAPHPTPQIPPSPRARSVGPPAAHPSAAGG